MVLELSACVPVFRGVWRSLGVPLLPPGGLLSNSRSRDPSPLALRVPQGRAASEFPHGLFKAQLKLSFSAV